MEIRLGQNIRALRKKAGLTQERLAEALGVTTGAVYKWESGKATPELEMLVDIADFFETSVDKLLNYEWKKITMGQAVQKLQNYCLDKGQQEGMRYAETVLQKYPNCFEVVYHSAHIYALSMDAKCMPRAVELYERALELIDQNEEDQINASTIQNGIAQCYCCMNRTDDAIEILKKNNFEGKNNYRIGLLLSRDKKKTKEALQYLSDALCQSYGELYNICIGYANAYGHLKDVNKVRDIVLWLQKTGSELRTPDVVNWMDRGDVGLFTILAEADISQGNEQGAYQWLLRAKESAEKFDAAPCYRLDAGMKFYHNDDKATSYDDMGETAKEIIEKIMKDSSEEKELRRIWKKVCEETGGKEEV